MPTDNTIQANPLTLPQTRLLQYRITLELTSPLAIGSGASNDLFDTPCARDANGLPVIPGTSLAGALRSLWVIQFGEACAQQWFGMITPNSDEGRRSRLLLTWAHVHGADNKPVDGVVPAATIQDDPVLRQLVRLPHRDHVRLSHRGGAADTAKYDRSFVPAGCRFTFDMRLFSDSNRIKQDTKAIGKLLQACWCNQLWLGGAKAAGYGRNKVVAIKEVILDLTNNGARTALRRARELKAPLPEASESNGVQRRSIKPVGEHLETRRVALPPVTLRPRDTWRIGSGAESIARLQNPARDKKLADALPYTETRLTWRAQQGQNANHKLWVTEIVVPGSAIRGALAHRTAFHFNRLQLRWVRSCATTTPPAVELPPLPPAPLDVIEVLFGSAKTRVPVGGDVNALPAGQAGAVFVEDTRIATNSLKVVQLPHVRIDRFTGGAFGGALFAEELLFQGDLSLQISIDKARFENLAQTHGVDTAATALMALDEALRDLCEQRLPVGAGGAHGHGYCTGTWPAQMMPELKSLERALLASNTEVTEEATV